MAEYDVRMESEKIDVVRVSECVVLNYIDKYSGCCIEASDSSEISLNNEEIANLIKALEKVQELQAAIVPKNKLQGNM